MVSLTPKLEDKMTFDVLGLSEALLNALKSAGYSEPTPIQAQAIPLALQGKDIVGIAQTGTGKTASFVLPMIEKLAKGRARARMPRTLILEPTRELAAQVAENFEKYGVNHKLSMALLIGGVSFGDQDRLLNQGADILIATPGRLLDQFERGKLLMTGVEMFVIDEADRMLDMGFIPDIERICKLLPPRRQTLLFSATMPPEIAKLAKQFQKYPERIEVSRPAQTADTITQYVVRLSDNTPKAKRAALRAVLRRGPPKNGIIFCNRKREVDLIARSLNKHGFDAAAIHGDLPQSYRTQTLDKFRAGALTLLVASDVAARGLDIPDVRHVLNFSPPSNPDDYVHRIGRTGRAGRKGEAFTLFCPQERKFWDAIMHTVNPEIKDISDEITLSDISEQSTHSAQKPQSRPNKQTQDKASGRSAVKSHNQSSSAKESEVLIIGMGDHVPAFLAQPVRLPKAKTTLE